MTDVTHSFFTVLLLLAFFSRSFFCFAVVETDPNAETLHWLECMQLKKSVYSQPR